MDQRELLSHQSTRCILVFFDNTIANLKREPSLSRTRWFENFKEHLGVSPLGYTNSKESGNYSEATVLLEMKYLPTSVKTWLIECSHEMITSDVNLELADASDVELYLEDVRILATRISNALDIPESDFYDIMDSKTAVLKSKTAVKSTMVDSEKNIYYSKYKTTGLFYNSGEFVFTVYPNETVSLTTADYQKLYYDIESLYEDRNDRVFVIRSLDSNQIGEFRLLPLGKAELSFGGNVILKLKI